VMRSPVRRDGPDTPAGHVAPAFFGENSRPRSCPARMS